MLLSERLKHPHIEEYYLFQPIELNNENISIYDRRNPIDFKHESIIYPLNESSESLKLKNSVTEIHSTNNMGNKIKTIENTFELANKPTTKLERGEDDWYVYAAMLHHTNYLKDNFNITTKEYNSI